MRTSLKLKDLSQLDIMNEHIFHRKRLDKIFSQINNTTPIRRPHIFDNLKGKINRFNKQSEIDTENKLLLDKILSVASRESPHLPTNNTRSLSKAKKTTLAFIEKPGKSKTTSYKSSYSPEVLKNHYKNLKKIKNMITKNSGRLQKYLNYSKITSPIEPI